MEGRGENWHGHVTAVTVAPSYRRQRLADKLMALLENVTEKMWVAATPAGDGLGWALVPGLGV